MITFAAVTPHTPLLIPTVGKENLGLLERTQDALYHLEKELYASRPDTLVVISSHEDQHADAFSANLRQEYIVDFKEFGDLTPGKHYGGDVPLVAEIQAHMQEHDIPFTLDSHESVHYGTGVPLHYLSKELPDLSVVPLAISGLDAKMHVQYGQHLREVFEQSSKRIAVIASGDLSHCLSKDAPLGFRPEGEIYDTLIKEAVANTSTSVLLSTKIELREKAQACIHEQLLVLFGVLEKTPVRSEILSYESPFGVGFLTAQFHFPTL